MIFTQCKECTQNVSLKTTVGRGDYEEFAFPCPGCGVELRYGVNLDQENGDLAYSGLRNMERVPIDEEAPVVRMDAAYLVPVGAPPLLSPFMLTMGTLGDRAEKYLELHKVRCDLPRNIYPLVAKAKVHLDAGNVDLFNRNATKLGYEAVSSTPELALDRYLEIVSDYSGHFLTGAHHAIKRDVLERCFQAQNTHQFLCDDLDAFFASDNRIELFFEQLEQIRISWSSKIAAILLPLYVAFEAELDLKEFVLCQKRFDELKQFYVDVYETFCRVSIVAAALEGVAQNGAVCVPKRRGVMTLAEYEVMANGSKGDILKNLSIEYIFCPYMGSSLRNGVGHNSSKYMVNDDTVLYRNQSATGIRDYSMPFSEFCFEVLKAYTQLEAAAPYLSWLYSRPRGLSLVRASGGAINLSAFT